MEAILTCADQSLTSMGGQGTRAPHLVGVGDLFRVVSHTCHVLSVPACAHDNRTKPNVKLWPVAIIIINAQFTFFMAESQQAVLILADGTEYHGYSFGAKASVTGEAVFQTGMVGYNESLTGWSWKLKYEIIRHATCSGITCDLCNHADPSYVGQLLVLTYPMIGNYGVPDEAEVDEHGISKHFESSKIHLSALIVDEICHKYRFALMKNIITHADALLYQPLVSQAVAQPVDGQSECSRHLRHRHPRPNQEAARHWLHARQVDHPGLMSSSCPLACSHVAQGTAPASIPFEDPNLRNLVHEVSTKTVRVYNPNGTVKVIVVDVGLKYNQLRCLASRGAALKVHVAMIDLLDNC